MKIAPKIHLGDVQNVYAGPEGRGQMRFLESLAKAGKIMQGLVVAAKA